MAFDNQVWNMEIRVVDSGENHSTVNFELTAATHLLAVTDAAIILSAFEAVCACGTVSYTLSQMSTNDSLVIPADSRVQVEAKALYIMRGGANPVRRYTKRVPGPEIDVMLAETGDGQNIMDIAHQDNLDFANLFGVAGVCTISDGNSAEVDGLIKGRRVTHRSRRG